MTRLRVLACLFTCCPPGKEGFTGGESLLGWNLLQQIARYHDIWAITQEEDRATLEQARLENGLEGVHFKFVGLPRGLRFLMRFQGGHQLYYYLWQLKAYIVARNLHKRIGFDLFHHITYANDWMTSFIGALLPVPYVRGPGGGAHRTPKGFEKEYPLGGRLWEKVRSLGQWVFRHDPLFLKGQGRARAILACNRESMDSVSIKWPHKVHFFPVNGISPQDLALTKPQGTVTQQFQVLSAGTLIRVKGFSLAIKGFKEFSDRYPQTQFTVIGSGPEEDRLRALARQSQLDGKLQILGWMPREDLLQHLAGCDVFLFPSLRDGGGAVIIEAMAAGKPVVCLDNGGPGTHVTDECGLKITPESPQQAARDLGAALETLFLDQELRHKLGVAARKRAEQVYQWDRLGDRLMDIYERALSRHPMPERR